MSNIGFDFGTTNSIISYYDRERKALDCFRPQAGSNPYIPTVISYGRVIEIGDAAKAEAGNSKTCSHFKLRLGSDFDVLIPGKEKTAHMAARDYIGELLESFQRQGNELHKIVMTIPEAWYRENSNFMARENIQSIYQELKVKQFCFQSEPVAAAAYYCWRYQYQQPEKNVSQLPYDGTLMIIDFGGGTLDVTLCEVKKGKRIRVLDSCGFGEEKEHHGCAGSAFDEEVVRILCEEAGITLNEHDFAVVRDEFEQKLIAKTQICTEMMLEYFEYPEGLEDEPLFSLNFLGGRSVLCRHLKQAFDKVNRPVLEKAVKAMQKTREFKLEKFKVVMVGGFSNFCCVEALVRELFGSRIGAEDIRFTNLLSQENKALAIAKGAALIADEVICVDPVFPYELGIVLGEPDKEYHYHDYFIPLIRKGELTERYTKPVYAQEKVMVMSLGLSECYARMYVGNEGERLIFTLDESVKDIFPLEEGSREYEIGLLVDENMIPELCIRSAGGKETRTQLNKLLEKIVLRKQ